LRASVVALAAVAVLVGCGERGTIEAGGRVSGPNLTIYSSLPGPARGFARDIVDAEKLAIMQAHGRAGDFGINFVSLDEGAPGAATPPKVVGLTAAEAIRDPQVIAAIGAARSDAALTEVPLYNAAGILLVSPGAGYRGFTDPIAPGEPEHWFPSGRQTFARLVGDDVDQAAALLRAARRYGPRVAVAAEPGKAAQALAGALREQAGRLVDAGARPDAIVYAGSDLRSALAFARGHARATLVFPDELTRAGLPALLRPCRRAVFVTAAPRPGSTPELRAFEAAFAAEFARTPGPYAVLGWRAMRRVLEAIAGAGPRGRLRRVVAERYLALPPVADGFTAFRARDGRREYLR
jgi:branched-chain amino acid transport system substrate-binding protein